MFQKDTSPDSRSFGARHGEASSARRRDLAAPLILAAVHMVLFDRGLGGDGWATFAFLESAVEDRDFYLENNTHGVVNGLLPGPGGHLVMQYAPGVAALDLGPFLVGRTLDRVLPARWLASVAVVPPVGRVSRRVLLEVAAIVAARDAVVDVVDGALNNDAWPTRHPRGSRCGDPSSGNVKSDGPGTYLTPISVYPTPFWYLSGTPQFITHLGDDRAGSQCQNLIVFPKPRGTRLTTSLAFVVLALSFSGAAAQVEEVKELVAPELPCPVRAVTVLGANLYLLGRCGVVLRWDPAGGNSSLIVPDELSDDAHSIAVAPGRLAILANGRRTVRVFDMQGKLLRELQYSGETVFTYLALVGDSVLASSYYDDHLVWLYPPSTAVPTRLVPNPRYWPDRRPRFSSYVHVNGGERVAYAFDLLDFTLYVIDPQQRAVIATYPKEPHPLWRPVSKPGKDAPIGAPHYTGSIIAVSADVVNDHVYVLMIDRSFGAQEKGTGYLEIAASKLSERKWHTLARLTDRTRYAGCLYLSVINNTAYLLKPGGTVIAVPLAGN